VGKLFGTDGIRGVANEEPMTPETVVKLGRAAAYLFKTKAGRHSIVIGKDTRLHGYMLECALFKDNGIKFFSGEGLKLPDEMEERMEALITGREIERLRPLAAEIGKAYRINDAAGRYIEFAKGTVPKGVSFQGVKVVVDCAHGATYKVAPTILNELGAVVIPVNIQPNGININDRCGSLYPDVVKKAVLEHRADIGISYDGDGDRAILVDETGAVVDGDHILAICALDLKRSGLLRSDTLVATVMSNIGLELCLREAGIRMVRVPVGDRYVLEEMLRHGYNLGGEQSGHIVFLDHNTTGDGVVTALQVLSLMVKRQERLSQLRQCMTVCPQLLVNVRVTEKPDLGSIPAIQAVISDAEAQLNGSGRVLVRYSGTESLARVMVEGTDAEQVKFLARSIAEAIEKELG
jgi:phosphoglucosamine mutase